MEDHSGYNAWKIIVAIMCGRSVGIMRGRSVGIMCGRSVGIMCGDQWV